MSQFKPSRRTKPERYDLTSSAEAAEYTSSGRAYKLTLWPPLDSTFPVVTCETATDGPAPETLPGWRIYRAWAESDGQKFAVVVIDESGARFSAFQFTPDGKPLAADSFTGLFEPRDAILGLLHKRHFEANSKPLEKSAYSSQVNPINEETLEHTWSAAITSTKPYYTLSGQVKELRAAGIDSKKFEFWRKVSAWKYGLFTHLVGEDCFGKTHVVSCLADGRVVSVGRHPDFISAVSAAPEQANLQFNAER